MDLQSKLAGWQRAGLLSAEQAAKIAAFEQESQRHGARPYAFYALGGLGALAVAFGLISLVASNWQEIPPGAKLVLDLLVGVGLVLGTLRAEAAGSRFVREILLLVLFGFVLASIGLVGQIYQLGGEAHDAMLLWSVITFAAMLHLRTGLGAAVWLVALEATWLMNAWSVIDKLGSSKEETILFVALWFVTALLLLLVGGAGPVRVRRPALARTAWQLGAVQVLGMMSIAPQFFYARIDDFYSVSAIAALVVMAVSLLVIARVPALLAAITGREQEPQVVLSVRVLLFYGTVLNLLACLLQHPPMGLVAALSFMVLWGLVGWVAYVSRSYPLFQVATAVLGVRLLGVYVEVLGSLLTSGLGLISGGLLTLGVAWYWRKKTVQMHGAFAAELPAEETGHETGHAAASPPEPASPPSGPQGGAP